MWYNVGWEAAFYPLGVCVIPTALTLQMLVANNRGPLHLLT